MNSLLATASPLQGQPKNEPAMGAAFSGSGLVAVQNASPPRYLFRTVMCCKQVLPSKNCFITKQPEAFTFRLESTIG
jgi:hypothetical protein